MLKETDVNRTAAQQSAATPHTSPGGGQAGRPAEQARGAEANQGRIAMRAYELYEERGRQEGQALGDWLDAERQLVGAAGTK